jgi:hypothetical protein
VAQLYSPWEIRTLDVPGIWTSGFGAFTGAVQRTAVQSTIGARAPGSYPWRDPDLRLAAADAARNLPYPQNSSGGDTDIEHYTEEELPGGSHRWKSIGALVGVESATIADRVLIGTYYDDWQWTMYLGNWWVLADDLFLHDMYQTPGFGPRAFLTPTEYQSLFQGPAPTGGPQWAWRQIDVLGSSIEFHVTLSMEPVSPTAPVLTRRTRDQAHRSQDWWQADDIEAQPAVGTLSGPSVTVVIGGAWGTSTYTRPRTIVTNAPVTQPIDEFDIANLRAGWVPSGVTVPDGDQWGIYREFIDYSPMWPTGVMPGYDESGGIPPPDPGSAVWIGGPAENRMGLVRMSMVTRVNLRMRWTGFTFGIPPLFQRQRIGALDAPESYASGLLTPWSSPWQGGML